MLRSEAISCKSPLPIVPSRCLPSSPPVNPSCWLILHPLPEEGISKRAVCLVSSFRLRQSCISIGNSSARSAFRSSCAVWNLGGRAVSLSCICFGSLRPKGRTSSATCASADAMVFQNNRLWYWSAVSKAERSADWLLRCRLSGLEFV